MIYTISILVAWYYILNFKLGCYRVLCTKTMIVVILIYGSMVLYCKFLYTILLCTVWVDHVSEPFNAVKIIA